MNSTSRELLAATEETFRAAMRLVLQPVALLACQEQDNRITSCVVNTVFPVSVEVPSIGVSLECGTRSCKAILEAEKYWVSFFSSDESKRMHRVAAAASNDRFSEAGLPDERGLPMMTSAAVAFECRRLTEFAAFDHFIILGEVLSIRMGEDKCLSV